MCDVRLLWLPSGCELSRRLASNFVGWQRTDCLVCLGSERLKIARGGRGRWRGAEGIGLYTSRHVPYKSKAYVSRLASAEALSFSGQEPRTTCPKGFREACTKIEQELCIRRCAQGGYVLRQALGAVCGW